VPAIDRASAASPGAAIDPASADNPESVHDPQPAAGRLRFPDSAIASPALVTVHRQCRSVVTIYRASCNRPDKVASRIGKTRSAIITKIGRTTTTTTIGHYGDWHHGNWHGNAGARWDHMWEEHTAAAILGVTRWGVNRIGSWMGYSSYSNPYYDGGSGGGDGGGYADYSQPVTMDAQQAADFVAAEASQPATATLPPGVSQEAVDKFDQGRGAFYNGQYAEALKFTDEALTKMPKDAVIQEFRALCLFALKRYREAAAVMNAVLAVGPGWDWTTMSGLYADAATYTAQLRALEDYLGKNLQSADVNFLAAYHYIIIGDTAAATIQLKRVLALQPNDTVAVDLLQAMSPSDKPASTTPAATPPAVAADAVVGVWTASGPKNARYDMTLTKDGALPGATPAGQRSRRSKESMPSMATIWPCNPMAAAPC